MFEPTHDLLPRSCVMSIGFLCVTRIAKCDLDWKKSRQKRSVDFDVVPIFLKFKTFILVSICKV
ncbi:hypothetical protein FG127_01720 [Vibrio cholerae]|nr:hypothetical protein [Vibrio cholerae]